MVSIIHLLQIIKIQTKKIITLVFPNERDNNETVSIFILKTIYLFYKTCFEVYILHHQLYKLKVLQIFK